MAFKNCRVVILSVTLSILAACGGGGGGGGGGAANSAPPTLDSITITPSDPSVRFAQTQQLTANGNYSDGSTQDLTSSVVWNSSDPNVAGIATGAPTPGLASGANVGTATATASFGSLTDAATLSVIGTVSLPKTGQVTCYDPSGNSSDTVLCPATGQDGDQPAGVDWPKTRFLPGKGSAQDCVTDSLTGFMWTKDANLPAAKLAPVTGKRTWQKALDYAKDLNLTKYCGFADWRLPNLYELESLVDGEVANQADNLNAKGFINVQAAGYWSSSSKPESVTAWGVDMNTGCTGTCHTKANPTGVYVWPVRGGR